MVLGWEVGVVEGGLLGEQLVEEEGFLKEVED